jgi:peptidoglycan/xylan/chitin deacetylase (PgdA/CDA1 family)
MYHHVNLHQDDFITVRVDYFKEQMEGIAAAGIHTLTAVEYRSYRRGEADLRKPSVLITFDDAWLDIYHYAFPILKTLGLRFTVFVSMAWSICSQEAHSDCPSRPLFPRHSEAESAVHHHTAPWLICNIDQLQEMAASGLMSLENHTAHHRVVGNCEASAWLEDCTLGQRLLKDYLGIVSRQLCWPKGRYTTFLGKQLESYGIDTTYLVRRGVNRPTGESLYNHRFTVHDRPWPWLKKQIDIFSDPIRGYLYARLKPDRYIEKLKRYF